MAEKLTYKDIKRRVEEEGYMLISKEYVNSKTPITVQCPKGHKPYLVRWSNFQSGKRCKVCGVKRRNEMKRHKPEVVKNEVEKRGFKLIEIIEGYNSKHKQLIVSCSKDKHDNFKISYQNLKAGRGCPNCKYDKNRTPIEVVRANFEDKGYKLLSKDYKNNRNKIKVLCPEKHEYLTTYGSFNAGKGCPICNESKGERLVKYILEKLIGEDSFTRQLPINIDNRTYRYDFCVYATDNLLIEYDGEGHYRPIEVYGGKEGYKQTVKNDSIKNKFAWNNERYQLLRIPYWLTDEDVEEVITNYLKDNLVL